MGRVKELDGWRTVSVGLVILDHLASFSAIHVASKWSFAIGRLGVEIFFVISGFVICRGLMNEAAEYGRISLPAFYIRRFFRIVPPLMLYITAVISLALAGVVDHRAVDAIRAFSFTCNFPAADCGGYLGGHIWSLSVEEQFYLMIPAAFLFLNRLREAASVFLIAIPMLIVIFGTDAVSQFAINFLPISMGVAGALNEKRLRRACALAPAWLSVTIAMALVAVLRLTFTRFWVPAQFAEAGLIGLMLLLSLRGNRVLSSAPMVTVGRASYGIYLWQQLATSFVPGADAAFYAVTIALCICGSLLMFATVERRLISIGHKLSASLRGANQAA